VLDDMSWRAVLQIQICSLRSAHRSFEPVWLILSRQASMLAHPFGPSRPYVLWDSWIWFSWVP